jgi:hypothetical protein
MGGLSSLLEHMALVMSAAQQAHALPWQPLMHNGLPQAGLHLQGRVVSSGQHLQSSNRLLSKPLLVH